LTQFASFNEEKGEKSIHEALRYIHNSDYSFENLDSHYRMLPLMKSAYKKFQISPSYKSPNDGYKICNLSLEITITPSDDRNQLIEHCFKDILNKIHRDDYAPFVCQKHCYSVDSPKVENYSPQHDAELQAFNEKITNKDQLIIKSLATLSCKISENYQCDLQNEQIDDL